jgi:hypothetical protein
MSNGRAKQRARRRQAALRAPYTAARFGTVHQHHSWSDLSWLQAMDYGGLDRNVNLSTAENLLAVLNEGCDRCAGVLKAAVLAGPRQVITTMAGYVYSELDYPHPGWTYTLTTADAHRAGADRYWNATAEAFGRMRAASLEQALEHALAFFTAPADALLDILFERRLPLA